MTVYFFELSHEGFDECLDIFSHFFKTPLLAEDQVVPELSAVNSEFINTYDNKFWKDFYV